MNMNHNQVTKYVRISITYKCNLNCFYCHREGDFEGRYTNDERADFSAEDYGWLANNLGKYGFKKIKLTGGEPTLREDLPQIIECMLGAGTKDLSIITNGINLLTIVRKLRSSGLPRLNVTLNTLNPERFHKYYGGSSATLKQIISGVDKAIDLGYSDIKVNTILFSEDCWRDFADICDFCRERHLTLVLLPLMNMYSEKIPVYTIDSLFNHLTQHFGVIGEEEDVDGEGIKRRRILLSDGTKVLLRKDEVGKIRPYNHCHVCEKQDDCTEGILPLRISPWGKCIPCLMGGMPSFDISRTVKERNRETLIAQLDEFASNFRES